MSFQNDYEAYVLGMIYGFGLPLIYHKPGASNSELQPGKYEIKGQVGDATRCITLAHHCGKSNLLLKYQPDEL